MDPRRRAGIAVIVIVGVVGAAALALWAALGSRPRTPGEREAAAQHLLAGIHITPSPGDVRFAATSAVADLGVQGGVHLLRVRILDELQLQVLVEADQTMAFAEPPRLCLVGPFSAPDDAGLSDPCWGDPDLGDLLLARMAKDPAGRPALEAGQAVTLSADLRRGDVRCDYPPGQWVLEMKLDPVVDGTAAGARYLPDVPFDVPVVATGPLRYLSETRYCGLATIVYRDQGEPPVQSP